jgi:geranylgeranyl diphosphate synthase type I
MISRHVSRREAVPENGSFRRARDGRLPAVDATSPSTSADDVRGLVERALYAFLEDRGRALPDAEDLMVELERVARSGGKRLRPAFCIWGYRAGGGTDNDSIARAAASLELLHTFAIIHDDVMDRSPFRRGMPATYKQLAVGSFRGAADRFGVSAAILA